MHKLWITQTWYLEVNDNGYIVGPWHEGALGCVVQLSRDVTSSQRAHLALKLPRLMAGTLSENEYIRSILSQELETVRLANLKGGQNSGLVPLAAIDDNPLMGLRSFAFAADKAVQEQDGCALFVSMKQGDLPRFCSAKFQNGKLCCWPSKLAADLAMSQEDWDALCAQRASIGSVPSVIDQPYRVAIAFFPGSSKQETTISDDKAHSSRIIKLQDSLAMHRNPADVWYVGLPAIPYDWASGTLQEIVSKGGNSKWDLKQHYALLAKALTGVMTLHEANMTHGDIRPANIMAMRDPAQADSYALGDYGGLEPVLEDTQATGFTVLGPSIHKFRQSVFYAPERRSGAERENADTLIILSKELDGKSNQPEDIFIHLGWREDLIDKNTNALHLEKEKELRAKWKALRENEPSDKSEGTADRLRIGDRIRVRDYVFTITRADVNGASLSYCCDRRFARVLYERITVLCWDPPMDKTVISIPMYTEIRKNSRASDIYSIGVLALYVLFMQSLLSTENDDTKGEALVTKDAEARVLSIVSVLEELACFHSLWGDLIVICKTVDEHESQKKITFEKLNDTLIKLGDRSVSFKKATSEVVDKILHFAPDLHNVLRFLKYNVLHFTLVIHFVLACLHRRTSIVKIPTKPNAAEGNKPGDSRTSSPRDAIPVFEAKPSDPAVYEVPFCETRYEQAATSNEKKKTLAAKLAMDRVEQLDKICSQTKYEHFNCQPTDFPRPSPLSDFQVKRQLASASSELDKAKVDCISTKHELTKAKEELEKIKTAIEERLKYPPGRSLFGYDKSEVSATRSALLALVKGT